MYCMGVCDRLINDNEWNLSLQSCLITKKRNNNYEGKWEKVV